MAETPNVCHQLHMPLQSGSDARAARRCAAPTGRDRYLGILDQVRAAMPDAAITTDIIVGFPGETEEDFQATLRRGRARPGSPAPSPSSTRPRPGTPAATMDDQVPKPVVQERYERLVALQDEIALGGEPQRWSAGPSRCWSPWGRAARTTPTGRMSGRARDGRLVHFAGRCRGGSGPATSCRPRSPTPRRTTWSPTAPVLSHRPHPGRRRLRGRPPPRTPGVLLGMPTVGAPAG